MRGRGVDQQKSGLKSGKGRPLLEGLCRRSSGVEIRANGIFMEMCTFVAKMTVWISYVSNRGGLVEGWLVSHFCGSALPLFSPGRW